MGGARARQPRDDDRPLDPLLFDLRVMAEQVLDPQPVREQLQHEPARADPAERREIGIALERLEQHRERLAKELLSIIVQPRARARSREQILRIERRRDVRDRPAERVECAQRERQPRGGEVLDVDAGHIASVRTAPPCEEAP